MEVVYDEDVNEKDDFETSLKTLQLVKIVNNNKIEQLNKPNTSKSRIVSKGVLNVSTGFLRCLRTVMRNAFHWFFLDNYQTF